MTRKILGSECSFDIPPGVRQHSNICRNYSWTYRHKWGITLIVSSFTFISPVSSSMIAPASEQLASQFGITNAVVMAMTTSVFVLGYGELTMTSMMLYLLKLDIAFGPLFLGPMSEVYGRSRVLQLANIWYLSTYTSRL